MFIVGARSHHCCVRPCSEGKASGRGGRWSEGRGEAVPPRPPSNVLMLIWDARLLRDARREPGGIGLRIADEEHGAVAGGRWRRDQHIVDLEVAIWREWNAGAIGAVFGKGCRGFTNQRREDAGVGV